MQQDDRRRAELEARVADKNSDYYGDKAAIDDPDEFPSNPTRLVHHMRHVGEFAQSWRRSDKCRTVEARREGQGRDEQNRGAAKRTLEPPKRFRTIFGRSYATSVGWLLSIAAAAPFRPVRSNTDRHRLTGALVL